MTGRTWRHPLSGQFGLDLISKYRGEIYGFAILWIVLFHGLGFLHLDYSLGKAWLGWLQGFLAAGSVGVDIFLFVSGISLYFSFYKNPDAAYFYRKRLARIVPCTILIWGIYWLVHYAILGGNILGFLGRIALVQFWITGDQSIWFVSLIVILYLAYPLIYRLMYGKHGHTAIACMAILVAVLASVYATSVLAPDFYDRAEIALTRIPVFVAGCAMGKAVFEKRQVRAAWMLLAGAGAVAFFAIFGMGVLHGMARRYLFAVGGISLAFCLAFFFYVLDRGGDGRRPWLYRRLSSVGAFSLELYLSHLMILKMLESNSLIVKGSILEYLAIMVVAILIAWLAMKATAPLVRKIKAPRQVPRQA